MSGGHYNYIQHQVNDVADQIKDLISKNGKEMSPKELENNFSWRDKEYYEKYPEDKLYSNYPIEIIEKFEEAVKIIKLASIYITRIDYLISGDDGKESFLERLEEEINNLNLLVKR